METYLIFMLQQEYFAVPVTKVLEVLQKQKHSTGNRYPPKI